jgi:hypothetical protein
MGFDPRISGATALSHLGNGRRRGRCEPIKTGGHGCFDATENRLLEISNGHRIFWNLVCDFRFGRHFFHRIVGSAATTLKGTSAWPLRGIVGGVASRYVIRCRANC